MASRVVGSALSCLTRCVVTLTAAEMSARRFAKYLRGFTWAQKAYGIRFQVYPRPGYIVPGRTEAGVPGTPGSVFWLWLATAFSIFEGRYTGRGRRRVHKGLSLATGLHMG